MPTSKKAPKKAALGYKDINIGDYYYCLNNLNVDNIYNIYEVIRVEEAFGSFVRGKVMNIITYGVSDYLNIPRGFVGERVHRATLKKLHNRAIAKVNSFFDDKS